MKRFRKLIRLALVMLLCASLLPANASAMVIQHNISAINSYRNLGINQGALSKNLEKLSSGYKINRAGDDAAGLAISEQMRAQINGLNTANKNSQDAISLVKTAEGAMQEVHDMLNRMTQLVQLSANGETGGLRREQLQKEFDALASEINRISQDASFNGAAVLSSTLAGQIASSESEYRLSPSTAYNLTADATNVVALAYAHRLANQKASGGFVAPRLEQLVNSLNGQSENITAAESRIRDVDMAKEMTQYTKNNILLQAARDMLKQANEVPQGVLEMLDSGPPSRESSVDTPRTKSSDNPGQWDGIITEELLKKSTSKTFNGEPAEGEAMNIYIQAAPVNGRNPTIRFEPEALEHLFSLNATLGINTVYGSISFSPDVIQALKEAKVTSLNMEIKQDDSGNTLFSIQALTEDGTPVTGPIPVVLTIPFTQEVQVGTYISDASGNPQPSTITSPNAGGLAMVAWLSGDGTPASYQIKTEDLESDDWNTNLFSRGKLLGLLPDTAEDSNFLLETITEEGLIALLYLIHSNGQGFADASAWYQSLGAGLPEGELTLDALMKFYRALGFSEDCIASAMTLLKNRFDLTSSHALTWGEALSALFNMADMGTDPASGTLQLASNTALLSGVNNSKPKQEDSGSDTGSDRLPCGCAGPVCNGDCDIVLG